MLDTFIEQKIRELVALAQRPSDTPINLRVAWATFGVVHGDDRWSATARQELDGINLAFEKYIGKLELAKFGSGAPPPEGDLHALLDRLRGLERLLPLHGLGNAPA